MLLTPSRGWAGSLFFSAVRALGVALLVFLSLLILDTSSPAAAISPTGSPTSPAPKAPGDGIAQALALTAVLVLASRIGRVVWVLSRLLDGSAGVLRPARPVPINETDEAPH